MRLTLTIRGDGVCWGCAFQPPRPVESAVLWHEADGWHGLGVCRFCFGTIQAERAANGSRLGIPHDDGAR